MLPASRAAQRKNAASVTIPVMDRCTQKGKKMSKGNNKRGNKETKKPKQEKAKVSATANSGAGKPEISIAGKKVK